MYGLLKILLGNYLAMLLSPLIMRVEVWAEGAKINLFPLVKKTDIYGPLKEIFPDLILDEPTRKLPARGKRYFYRIDFFG